MEKKLIPFVLILLLVSLFFNFYLFSKGGKFSDKGTNKNLANISQNQADKTISANLNLNGVIIEEGNSYGTGEVAKPTISEEDFSKLDTPEDFSFNDFGLEIFYNCLINNKEFFNENEDEALYFEIFRSYLFGKESSNTDLNELVKCFDGESYNLSGDLKQLCESGDRYVKEGDINYFHEKDFFISLKKILNGEDFSCDYFLSKGYDYPENQILGVKISDYFSCKAIESKKFDLKKQYFLFKEASKYEKCDSLDDKNLSSLCKEFSSSVPKTDLSDDINS